MHPLIGPRELSERLDAVRLFDLRWSLTDPDYGRAEYEDGHIPGAVFVDLDVDLSAESGDGRHPLPDVETFTKTLGSMGVSSADEVVVYDDVAGAVAARMWWMLRAIGHETSRLLDGGLRAWLDDGLPIATGTVEPNPTDYHLASGFEGVVRHTDLPGRTVVDVRAPERYTGQTEPVDPKAGHIPGAVNIPLGSNLEGGSFRDGHELAALFADLDRPVVSCGSGVNACHTALAMLLAGLPMPDVYIGSFSDWSMRDNPVNVGPDP